MGAEFIGAHLKDESSIIPSVPPGFASATSFTLQRIQDDVKVSECHDPGQTHMDIDCSVISSEKFTKSLRCRPWVNYRQFDDSSEEDEPIPELLMQDMPSISCLPKGVIRGCAQCRDCQKVTAKWRPEDACRPVLDEAPAFYPTEEEFKDTLKYIDSIRPIAEAYGICRIVPPPSWRPPCPLKEKDVWKSSKFVTRIQRVDKLQNRESMRKVCSNNSTMSRKRRRLLGMGTQYAKTSENIEETNGHGHYNNTERFGFEPGPDFTLESFQKYADDFKEQYFRPENVDIDLKSSQWEPSVENIEGEYWRIVERPTEEIEILYGADLETGDFGSGFPKRSASSKNSHSEDEYVKSGWNLNNLPRLPGSVLSFESGDISGVLVPWLYVGMCFSSFCWHVEDHHLYSLNYMHWGAPKLWYGVPGVDALKFEGAMKKHLAELFEEQPDLLHNLVTQFSPSMLKLEGVPVYRCVQRSGEFVLTFPRAYHSGFNSGFNCAEAVNVAPIDWLPHGQNAVELYREQGRKISISHDKLLLGAARESVRAQWEITFVQKNTLENLRWKDAIGVNGALVNALKARIETDRVRREYLCSSLPSRKMDASFDSDSERECFICHYDLHLSAAGCPCSPDKFACLLHVKQLCSCPWQTRFSLFRYEITELNMLADAVGAKLSAVHKWGLLDLGLSLSSLKERSRESQSPSEGRKQEHRMIKPSSLEVSSDQEKTKQVSMSASKEPCLQGGSLSEVENRHEESTKGQRDSDTCSSGSVSHQPSQEVGGSGLLSGKMKEDPSVRTLEAVTLNRHKELVLAMPATNASVIDKDIVLQPAMEKSVSLPISVPAKVQVQEKSPSILPNRDSSQPITQITSNMMSSASVPVAIPVSELAVTEADESKNTSVEADSCSNLMDRGKSIEASSSSTSNNLERCTRLVKGPRMAKVVRRINCNVEPMEYGAVLSGKLWSTSQAIFPKGYRSRVRYLSILDPAQMCYYVSEILDAGMLGPLFMVVVEQCPTEVFIHVSATKCWDMVRERVNNEIRRQHSLGKGNLPILQPPGSLDGLEMFGLSSQKIIQAIEAIDRDRVCTDYWSSRSQAPPSPILDVAGGGGALPPSTDVALRGLFMKAGVEELLVLQGVLRSEVQDTKQEVIQLLSKEIESRSK